MVKKYFDFIPFEKPLAVQTLLSGKCVIEIDDETVSLLAEKAFERISFTFTREHIENLIEAALADDSSDNDRYVCASLLKNAQTAAQGVYPICQDTGIANVFAWHTSGAVLGGDLTEKLSRAVEKIYTKRSLRFSTVCPSSFFKEADPRNNLPAHIMTMYDEQTPQYDSISAEELELSCRFLFCAKGGGSSNKTIFIQGTKADLNSSSFENLLREKISSLGTSACPPYHIAVCAGGLSPEQNLLTLKLASCGYYTKEAPERLPKNALLDEQIEDRILQAAKKTGLGAQFGGSRMALSAAAVRLPRHGASCPISIGVSCSAHRNIEAVITRRGMYIEQTVSSPESLPGFDAAVSFADSSKKDGTHIDLSAGIDSCRSVLDGLAPGTRILLSGTILVARDAAHAKWKQLAESGADIPSYTKQYPICYAGPAETPEGRIIGSFGPTTAGRMDSYGDFLMSRGAALITLAKGNRSASWKNACRTYGGFYLGTIGGAAALLADKYITSSRVIDYPELGMEAVRLVDVQNLPVFMLTDNKGVDFYERISADKS